MKSEPPRVDTVLAIHHLLIEKMGGADEIRDMSALLGAINAPWQGFSDMELYPTTLEKAARIAFEMITQHPFLDGNKRTGAALMFAVLGRGKIELQASTGEMLGEIKAVAAGTHTYGDLLRFLLIHKK